MVVCIESGQSLEWCGDIRGFEWFGTGLDGFGHGAYHVSTHLVCFPGEVKALDYQSR